VRTVFALALLAGIGVLSANITWWGVGLAVAFLAWGAHDLWSRTRFRVDHGTGRLELPHGDPIPLDSIHEVSVTDLGQNAAGMSQVSINLGQHRWIPVYVGAPDWAREVEQFIRRARQTRAQRTAVQAQQQPAPQPTAQPAAQQQPSPQQPAQPTPQPAAQQPPAQQPPMPQYGVARFVFPEHMLVEVPMMVPERALALASSIEQARGQWGRAERIICLAMMRSDRQAGLDVASLPPQQNAYYVSVLLEFDQWFRSGAASPSWRELSADQVHPTLTSVIGKELAYGHQYAPEPAAAALATELMSLFTVKARFFTAPDHVRVSRASFDRGVVAIDDYHAGLVWFESDSPGR
jgi:hypothetical protein